MALASCEAESSRVGLKTGGKDVDFLKMKKKAVNNPSTSMSYRTRMIRSTGMNRFTENIVNQVMAITAYVQTKFLPILFVKIKLSIKKSLISSEQIFLHIFILLYTNTWLKNNSY